MRNPVTYVEISKEEFEKHTNDTPDQIFDYVLTYAVKSSYSPCGYGFFYPHICKREDKYYVAWEHYRSCD